MRHRQHVFLLHAALGIWAAGSACAPPSATPTLEASPPAPDAGAPPQDAGGHDDDDVLPDAGASAPPRSSFVPAPGRMRRLLSYQYENSVRDLLGDAAAAALSPPPDVALNGFASIGSATLSVSPLDVERYEQSAYAAAAAAIADQAQPPFRLCTPVAFDDEACAQQILAVWGRRVFRRPLDADDMARWLSVWRAAVEAYGDFDRGLEFLIAGMLQAPSFLYVTELGVADEEHPEWQRLSGYELASRMAFFLTGTTPSDALLDAAAQGLLDDAEGVRLFAGILLSYPETKGALRSFFRHTWGLDRLDAISRPHTGYNATLGAAMREETLRLVDDIVWERNADARELLTAPFTYVNDELAGLYGLTPPGTGADHARIELPLASERRGILTQGAFLVRYAHENRSSPTLRGKFIRENLLCQAVPPPPNDVNTVLPEPTDDDTPRTTRERMAAHVENESCAGCHSLMDPLGYPLERFDQAGRYRTEEYGLPVRTDADVDGTTVQNAAALAEHLATYTDVPRCLVRNLFRHGTGHLETFGELESLLWIEDRFEASGYRLRDAMMAIVESNAFRFVSLPEGGE